MDFNLADLWERVADTVPDHEALVCGDRRLTYAEADERADPARATSRRARHRRRATTSRSTSTTASSTSKAMLAAFKLARGPDQRELPLRRGRAALPPRRRRRDARRVPPRVRAEARRDPRRRCPRCSTFVAVDDGTDADRTAQLGAVEYEAALAGARPARDFGPRSRRRPLHPLHRRHHRHAEGRHVAPRGHLLRRARRRGRRRRRRSRRPRRSPSAASSRAPGACPRARSCTAPRTGWRSATLFTGGTVVIPRRAPPRPARALAARSTREQANFLVIVGDAFARPLLDALDTPRGRALDVSSLRVLLSGGAILSPVGEARARSTACPACSSSTASARRRPAVRASRSSRRRRRRSRPRRRFRVDDDTHGARRRPAARRAGRRRPARPPRPRSRSATTRTRRRPRRRSRSSTACAGRCPATTRCVEDDGTITLLGRGSVSINTGGEKVYPEEVESVLKAHADVFDAVVVGVPDERWGERVVAVVQPRAGRARRRSTQLAGARPRAPRRLQGAARASCSSTRSCARRRASPTTAGPRRPRSHGAPRYASTRDVNRLADETSPYLRQHADNPVDWYPWGDEAFARRARPRTSRSSSRSATRRATGAT